MFCSLWKTNLLVLIYLITNKLRYKAEIKRPYIYYFCVGFKNYQSHELLTKYLLIQPANVLLLKRALAFSSATWTAMSRLAFIYSLTAFFRHFPSESGTGTIFLLMISHWHFFSEIRSISTKRFLQFSINVTLCNTTNFEKSWNKCFYWVNFTLLYQGILHWYRLKMQISSPPQLTGSGRLLTARYKLTQRRDVVRMNYRKFSQND